MPDSFEAYKFMLFTSGITREEPRRAVAEMPNIHVENPPDTHPSLHQSSEAQFEDLHNRIQSLAHSMDGLFVELAKLADRSEGRHQELSRNFVSADRINALDQKLNSIETTVRDFQGQFSGLQNVLKDSHSSLAEGLPKHMSDSRSFPTPATAIS